MPTELVAATSNLYAVPGKRPVTLDDVTVPPVTVTGAWAVAPT